MAYDWDVDVYEPVFRAAQRLVGSTHNPVKERYFPWGGLTRVQTNKMRTPVQPWQEWMKDRENKVHVVNGKVHAICGSSVVLQRPEHYERCPSCKVYADTEAWQMDGAIIAFGKKDYERVECGFNCNRCKDPSELYRLGVVA